MSRPHVALDKFAYFPRKNPLKNVDIDAEYKLIQQKKSKLPAKLRKGIVAMVESKSKATE